MPAAALIGRLSSGHSCYPPTASKPGTGSLYTQVNGLDVQLLNITEYYDHRCGRTIHRNRLTSSSSNTVFIEGYATCRIGDSINCGDTVANGSYNVFIGD